MDLARADAAHDRAVRRRDVADVRGEAVGGVERVGARACSGRASPSRRSRPPRSRRSSRRRRRPRGAAARAARAGSRRRGTRRPAGRPRAPRAGPRRFDRCRPSRSITAGGKTRTDTRSAHASDGAEELLAPLGSTASSRSGARAAATRWSRSEAEVEQHAGDDERPGERPAPGLVGAGDEADARAAGRTRAACGRSASPRGRG